MSPPIIRQKWRVMTRPRPLPPYFRVVDASAWLKALNNRLICSADIPIPVSDTWKITTRARAGFVDTSQRSGCLVR
jgi:hypothetical protein